MKLRAPTTPGEIWIHYDRLGAKKGSKPAAVQVCGANGRSKYFTAHQVVISCSVSSVFEPLGRQPHFYFRVEAGVGELWEIAPGVLSIAKRKPDRVQKARPVKGR